MLLAVQVLKCVDETECQMWFIPVIDDHYQKWRCCPTFRPTCLLCFVFGLLLYCLISM